MRRAITLRHLFFYFLLLFFPNLVWAEDVYQLESTEVSAQANQFDHNHLIQLDQQDYAYESLDSLLNKTSGVQTQIAGGSGSYSSIWIRGASSKASSVYLDGIRINDPLNAGINLSTIPLWSLESINIYKSQLPSHVGFGDGNNGLILNTRKNSDYSDLKLSLGSFNQKSLAINSNFNDNLVSAEIFQSDNDFPYSHNNNTLINSNDDYQTKRKNNGIKRGFGLFKSKWLGTSFNLDGLALVRNYYSGVSNLLNHADTASLEQSSFITAFTLQPNVQPKNQNWQATAQLNMAEHYFQDLNGEIGLTTDTQSIDYQQLQASISHKFILDNEYVSSRINASQLNLNSFDIIEETEKKLSLNKKQIAFSQSYHSQKNHYSYTLGQVQTIDHTTQYWNFSSNLSYEFNDISTTFSFSRKVRLATISELYLNQGNQTGNQSLKPEVFHELSFKSKKYSQNYQLNLEGFFRQSKDTILFSYNSQGIGRADNFGGALLYGLEGQIDFNLAFFEVSINTSIMNSKNLYKHTTYENKYLPNFFHLTSFLIINYAYNHNLFTFESQYRDGLFFDAANTQQSQQQTQFNLSLESSFSKGTFGLKVNNLLDSQFTGFQTQPLPGRNLTFTIQYFL